MYLGAFGIDVIRAGPEKQSYSGKPGMHFGVGILRTCTD